MRKLFLLFFLFLLSPRVIFAKEGNVLIINQIRGSESCCEKGEVSFVKKLQEDKTVSSLPFSWALRYDAIKDDTYAALLKNEKELGVLLEVTPRLAADSGIVYRGNQNGSDWYFAKHVFLVGYKEEERKKIIDTVMQEFKLRFGYYPRFTAAWMIDAWSLEYLKKEYGVLLHELTKEQYETDSYSLYGGIFNASYFPSKFHPLIPGSGNTMLDIVMVRQTISDLLNNYGSSHARFTSQPNDYLGKGSNLDTSYFRSLLENVSEQTADQSVAVLGFENSYKESRFLDEYMRQLAIVSELRKKGSIEVRSAPDYAKDVLGRRKKNEPFFLTKDFSSDKKNGVLWFFSPKYRARILKKSAEIILDDVRIYTDEKDPYYIDPVSSDYAYWVIPYAIDGSQQFTGEKGVPAGFKDLVGGNTAPDVITKPFGVVLGSGPFTAESIEGGVRILFTGDKKGGVEFLEDSIRLDKKASHGFSSDPSFPMDKIWEMQTKKTFSFNKQFDFVLQKEQNIVQMGWTRQDVFLPLLSMKEEKEQFVLTPQHDLSKLAVFSSVFQPDRSDLSVDTKRSIFYWNNTRAIAGRNPLMLYILPLNSMGRPVAVKDVSVTSSAQKDLTVSYPDDYSYRVTPWFITISSAKPLSASMNISVDGKNIASNMQIEFSPDCKKMFWECVRHPLHLYRYIRTLFEEKKREFSDNR